MQASASTHHTHANYECREDIVYIMHGASIAICVIVASVNIVIMNPWQKKISDQ